MTRINALGAAILAPMIISGASQASDREMRAFLEDATGARIHVADIIMQPDGQYELSYVDAPFGDYFLSMRPFRCIAGNEKHWCHLPYPYENRRNVAADPTDLEYDFLFIWKDATEYGIDTWNGVYYQLEPEGEGWRGALNEIDMDILAVPPEAGNFRPVQAKHLEPGDPQGHWLPWLVIE
ncbi:hypothetical protein PGB28_06145 [Primorskyibacter aestuariivivens]|uniref:hypothetical protein n=1 Tax=Primorskyibacter aestuariivivens TaxID=1888912 RepID=UPI0022FFD742|nr:hypothetical protein [Primorskyibacter aestuariivivens]MDA7428031.1 hypothetical protein [Primorskyibacter aestuariivivens]